MSAPVGVRLYRWSLRAYPRSFREEYGPDMVALLEHQLRDENSARVWGRIAIDVIRSVPTRHLEVHMNRPPNFLLPALFGGLTTTGVLLVVIGGAGGTTLTVGSVLAVASGALAVLFWRDTRAVGQSGSAHRWWKFLAGGVLALGAFVFVTAATGELSDRAWAFAMVALAGALVLMSTGLILGVAHFAGGRQRLKR